jgi:hypothetical protein
MGGWRRMQQPAEEREKERESAKEEEEEKLSGTANRVESGWAWQLFWFGDGISYSVAVQMQ